MARTETLARARGLDRSAVAYLVPFRTGAGIVDLEVRWEDLARDTAWADERLHALGLVRGRRVLVTFSGSEGAWIRPLLDALRGLGMVYGTAEAMGWDHNRTTVFHRELDLQAVLGLSAETVEGLSGRAALGDIFHTTPLVWARPDAARLLRAAGVPAGVLTPLGPTLVIECRERRGAHVNAAEWEISDQDDHLAIAPTGTRGTTLGRVVLTDRGRVLTDPCPCGSTDPRVVFAGL